MDSNNIKYIQLYILVDRSLYINTKYILTLQITFLIYYYISHNNQKYRYNQIYINRHYIIEDDAIIKIDINLGLMARKSDINIIVQ